MPPASSYILNNRPHWLLALCLLGLAACSNTPTTAIFTPAKAEHDRASVYVYRPSRTSNAMYAPELYINSRLRQKITNGQQVHFSLPAGEAFFELRSDSATTKPGRQMLDLRPGNTCFLRVDTSLGLDKGPGYKPYQRSFTLLEIPAEQATREIALCCSNTQKPSKAKDTAPEAGPVRDNDGFTTDKTQNPFSH